MGISTFEELIALLKQENLPMRPDEEQKVVELPVRTGSLETEMVIRWEQELVLAQFIVAFPYRIPQERSALVEHAMALVNHRLILPGFSMNSEARLLYYRLVVPRKEDGSLSADYILRLISTAIDTMVDFFDLFSRVVRDGANPEALLAEVAPRVKLPAAVRPPDAEKPAAT